MEKFDDDKFYDQRIEASILGCFLSWSNDSKQYAIKCNLRPEHFYVHEHVLIMEQILKADGNVTCYTLGQILPESKEYLVKLSGYGLGLMVLPETIKVLKDLYKRRIIKEFSARFESVIYNKDTTADEIILSMSKQFDLSLKQSGDYNFSTSTEVSQEIVQDLLKENQVSSTGLNILDKAMCGGFYRGKAYAIAARKKTGKTVLAATISANLNDIGKKHLFIAAEMSAKEIHQRVIARKINKNPISFLGYERTNPSFIEKVESYKDAGNVLYCTEAGIKFDRLKMIVSAAVYKHKIEGFVLDYFQLVGGAGREGLTSHYDEVAQWIATFCRENNVWALVMAQMNQTDNIRGGEGIRLAFDQVYELKRCGNEEDGYSNNGFWLDLMDTRYTPYCEMGSEKQASLDLVSQGLYFKDF
jgi:replicative DNA helicase